MDKKENVENQIETFMNYVSKIRNNGALDIFTQLFQTDYRILSYLSDHPNAHPSILADALKVTRPNIAANLRLLEQRGYIERTVDEKNRRQVYVNMTESGRQYLQLVKKQLEFLFSGWFQILGKEETKHLFKILELSSDPKIITDNLSNFTFGN